MNSTHDTAEGAKLSDNRRLRVRHVLAERQCCCLDCVDRSGEIHSNSALRLMKCEWTATKNFTEPFLPKLESEGKCAV